MLVHVGVSRLHPYGVCGPGGRRSAGSLGDNRNTGGLVQIHQTVLFGIYSFVHQVGLNGEGCAAGFFEYLNLGKYFVGSIRFNYSRCHAHFGLRGQRSRNGSGDGLARVVAIDVEIRHARRFPHGVQQGSNRSFQNVSGVRCHAQNSTFWIAQDRPTQSCRTVGAVLAPSASCFKNQDVLSRRNGQ